VSANELYEVSTLVSDALRGKRDAVASLVDRLAPVIQSRVARALYRYAAGGRGRDVRQEVSDMTQEVFLALFENDGRALRAWDPNRAVSLEAFVGVIAEHQVVTILRSGRRSPWSDQPFDPGDAVLPASDEPSPELHAASRETLHLLLDRIRERLSPRGMLVMDLLLVERRSVDEVCEITGLQRDAVHARASRIAKLAREIATKLDTPNLVSANRAPTRTASRGALHE
jgi:RNA polymerase sigma-70 factor (ECF subfamily)